jgi:hypothetical protein
MNGDFVTFAIREIHRASEPQMLVSPGREAREKLDDQQAQNKGPVTPFLRRSTPKKLP